MNEIKELHVIKSNKGIEVSVQSDTVTALALLSVLILTIEKEMGISAEKILDIVRTTVESMEAEKTETPKKRVAELEALGTPIVKWLKDNYCSHGAVIVDSYGIRLVRDGGRNSDKEGEKE